MAGLLSRAAIIAVLLAEASGLSNQGVAKIARDSSDFVVDYKGHLKTDADDVAEEEADEEADEVEEQPKGGWGPCGDPNRPMPKDPTKYDDCDDDWWDAHMMWKEKTNDELAFQAKLRYKEKLRIADKLSERGADAKKVVVDTWPPKSDFSIESVKNSKGKWRKINTNGATPSPPGTKKKSATTPAPVATNEEVQKTAEIPAPVPEPSLPPAPPPARAWSNRDAIATRWIARLLNKGEKPTTTAKPGAPAPPTPPGTPVVGKAKCPAGAQEGKCSNGQEKIKAIVETQLADLSGLPKTYFGIPSAVIARLTGAQVVTWCTGLANGTFLNNESIATTLDNAGLGAMWVPNDPDYYWTMMALGLEGSDGFCNGLSFKAAIVRACQDGVNFMMFIQAPSVTTCLGPLAPLVSLVTSTDKGYAFGLSNLKLLGGDMDMIVPETEVATGVALVARTSVEAFAHIAMGIQIEVDIANVLGLPTFFSNILSFSATAIIALGVDGAATDSNNALSTLASASQDALTNLASVVKDIVKLKAPSFTGAKKAAADLLTTATALSFYFKAAVSMTLNLKDLSSDILADLELMGFEASFILKTSAAKPALAGTGRVEALAPGFYFYSLVSVSIAPVKWFIAQCGQLLQWLGIEAYFSDAAQPQFDKLDAQYSGSTGGFYFGGYITSTSIGFRAGFLYGNSDEEPRDYELWCQMTWKDSKPVFGCQSSLVSIISSMLWDGAKFILSYGTTKIREVAKAATAVASRVATTVASGAVTVGKFVQSGVSDSISKASKVCRWVKARVSSAAEKFSEYCLFRRAGMLVEVATGNNVTVDLDDYSHEKQAMFIESLVNPEASM